ncbi:hypothetical protein AN191_05650 [Loktanella sp. 5RATIMAR09]|uniref:glycosyltransferase family 2 protein n=1 Tax=Loktanella sp. 5RATIMAR09 TaxID=1225655 RepID=UPI0006EBBDC8|nr:glycosyltransferase family 2 protein [Loktanella sp. 5RATIMAR09]KQI72509.1 hypothetical protein AN191_05650 [Loktanella sp. 5RATIMAR09]
MKRVKKIGLFSCIKNEGPFILEWVAYHINSGFSAIVVYSNDCTDGSAELLDALADNGVIHHHAQDLKPGQTPQFAAAEKAYQNTELQSADWLMWMDTDEFLFCNNEGNSVLQLAEKASEVSDGVAVNWLNFGDNGFTQWEPGLVTQRFLKRGPDNNSRHATFKTLFKRSDSVRGFGLHRPHVHGDFQEQGKRFVNAAGNPMPATMYRSGKRMRHGLGAVPPEAIAHDWAAICHYAVKTKDSFLLKKLRGQGTKPVDADDRDFRFQDRYWRVYNQNAVLDDRMIAQSEKLMQQIKELAALPGVAAAHDNCLRIYRARLDGLVN